MNLSQQPTAFIVDRFQQTEISPLLAGMVAKAQGQYVFGGFIIMETPAKSTWYNPLDLETRRHMLQQAYPNMPVYNIMDRSRPAYWSNELDKMVAGYGQVVLIGGNDLVQAAYCGQFHTEIEQHPDWQHPEPQTIAELRQQQPIGFRAGMFAATANQYPKALPTVDVVVKSPEGKFLLAQKEDEQGWRFVGGFTDPTDPNYEAAAARELKEETGIEAHSVHYIGSAAINDWRYHGKEPNKVITMFFMVDDYTGNPYAADDIAKVDWFEASQLTDALMVSEHLPVLELLKKYLQLQK